MATTSPILALPLPSTGDTDQVPADLMTLITAAEKYFVGRFATATARNTAIPSPIAGMFVYLTSPGQFQFYNGTAWVLDKNLTSLTGQNGLVGTYAGQAQLWDAGTASATIIGSVGGFNVNFKTPFPNGLLSVVAMGGNTGVGAIIAQYSYSTLSLFSGQAYGPTGSYLTNGTVFNLTYQAVGW